MSRARRSKAALSSSSSSRSPCRAMNVRPWSYSTTLRSIDAIDAEVHERWLREHRMQLFYLPPYSPELNLIEIVWKQAKYHWRRFVTWTKETIDDEVRSLLEPPPIF